MNRAWLVQRVLGTVIVFTHQSIGTVGGCSRRRRSVGLVLAVHLTVGEVGIVQPVGLHELELPGEVGDERDEVKAAVGYGKQQES